MSGIGLTDHEVVLMCSVFGAHPDIREAILFGSRAKGTFRPQSDVDLALIGLADDLEAEAVADDLDRLPLPYRFDVKAHDAIAYQPLRDHIRRVGVSLYRRDSEAINDKSR